MRFFVLAVILLTTAQDVFACGLRAPASDELLRAIAEQSHAPADKSLPRAIVSGAGSVLITDENGNEVKIDSNFTLKTGMTITSRSGSAKIILPSTGQIIELQPRTELAVLALNKYADQKICSVSFAQQSGSAQYTSNHLEREGQCKATDLDMFEVVTPSAGLVPVGTKYNVDLNQAIAELNGENYNEEISVDKGAVKVRIIKLKKSRKKSQTKEENLAAADYVFDDQKPVTVKAGKKARIKKSKKDRMADIQIIYPE
jgi:hypothetical protein